MFLFKAVKILSTSRQVTHLFCVRTDNWQRKTEVKVVSHSSPLKYWKAADCADHLLHLCLVSWVMDGPECSVVCFGIIQHVSHRKTLNLSSSECKHWIKHYMLALSLGSSLQTRSVLSAVWLKCPSHDSAVKVGEGPSARRGHPAPSLLSPTPHSPCQAAGKQQWLSNSRLNDR